MITAELLLDALKPYDGARVESDDLALYGAAEIREILAIMIDQTVMIEITETSTFIDGNVVWLRYVVSVSRTDEYVSDIRAAFDAKILATFVFDSRADAVRIVSDFAAI